MVEKLSITLPADMVRIIKEQVEAGGYSSTSEVIREALRVWRRSQEEHAARLDAIRSRIARSVTDPRPDVPIGNAFARLHDAHEDTVKRFR